jgi:hypothetical protein
MNQSSVCIPLLGSIDLQFLAEKQSVQRTQRTAFKTSSYVLIFICSITTKASSRSPPHPNGWSSPLQQSSDEPFARVVMEEKMLALRIKKGTPDITAFSALFASLRETSHRQTHWLMHLRDR